MLNDRRLGSGALAAKLLPSLQELLPSPQRGEMFIALGLFKSSSLLQERKQDAHSLLRSEEHPAEVPFYKHFAAIGAEKC